VNRALRAATLGVLLLSPVALSACSAGRVTQTATQVRDKTGGQGQVGDIRLRAVQLAAPDSGSYTSGGNAELKLAISNDGSQGDTLTGVSGSGFSRAVFADVASLEGISTGAASSSAAPSAPSSSAPAAGSSATGAPATGVTPTASASASSSAAPTEIPVPAGQTVFVGPGQQDSHITLMGLDKSLTTGQYVTLTFTFAKAGDVTVLATPATPSAPMSRAGTTYDFNQTQGSDG
jgi:Copper chaperone PCu(A)C